MGNPFLGSFNVSTPSAISDPHGDYSYFPSTPWHIVGFLIFALAILTALKVSGFRAMVGIGRG